jgi:hypothetical protein
VVARINGATAVAQGFPIDPDKGIPDLLKQVAADSRRIASDEVRLAKLETAESVREAGKGAIRLGIAFGAAVVMLVGATLLVATFFGRISGHMWVGALLAAAIDIAAGLWLLQRGKGSFKRAPYSLPDTRQGLKLIRR